MDKISKCKYCDILINLNEIDSHIDSQVHKENVMKKATPEEKTILALSEIVVKALNFIIEIRNS